VDDYLFDEELVLLGEDGAPFGDRTKPVAFRVEGRVWVNNHIHVLRARPDVDSRFLTYVLNSIDWVPLISGTTRDKLTQDDMGQAQVPDPGITNQLAIADFLDRETGRIDALINDKRRMIDLTAERSQALNAICALGCSGDAERRSRSGLYGELPQHWGETELRHLRCDVQTGPFGSQLHAEDYVEDGWPVVNPVNLSGGAIQAVERTAVSDEKRTELSRHVLIEGDIVFGRRGEMGRAGLVEAHHAGWLCGTGSLRLRLSDARLIPEYLKLLLETGPAKAFFQMSSVGSTMDNLNTDILLSFPVVMPPVVEQRRAIELVAAATRRAGRLVEALVRQIELLQERRHALVTAAVSGQLEIPGVVA
jgi:type I restriction enzyme S subunit